jgi:hypothetical protein
MIRKDLPLPDLAALLCEACRASGVGVVLSGGACVSIYTRNKYESFDLDFVLASHSDRPKAGSVLEGLGFRRDGRHYRHARTPYIVEFLSPPLSVGSEPVREINEIRRGKAVLRLLSPTDCVKDRLAAFYHWNDRPSLDQAILVCSDAEVDLREVRRWSLKEGMKEKHKQFREALAGSVDQA